jgi:hypothetical protein
MKKYWAGVLLLFLSACTTLGTDVDAEGAALRWGKSFGMCAGYCKEDLEVDSAQVTLTRSGWGELPTQVAERTVTAETLRNLLQRVDVATIRSLDARYGCPDCADGGAEYVELQTREFTKRIEFEYGKAPQQLENLVNELRALRATFPTQ